MIPQAQLEHANVTVKDPHRFADLMKRLFGWKIRWEGEARNNGYTVHVGTRRQYIAAYQNPDAGRNTQNGSYIGRLNHLAFEVRDLEKVLRTVKALGHDPYNFGDYQPGRRFYFDDENGIEFEIVSYSPPPREWKKWPAIGIQSIFK